MTCNICGVSDATIHLTEIINNQMIEIHLCETCAQEKGTDFKTHFNLGDLLAGLTDFEKVLEGGEAGIKSCSDCGTTYENFTKNGRLGCSNCYVALAPMLLPLIKRVQRSAHHIGKKPAKIPKEVRSSHDLRLLQDQLRKCIQNEEFEVAAKIRDEIKQLQDQEKEKKPKRVKDGKSRPVD